jgi:ribosome biogenesis GTPase
MQGTVYKSTGSHYQVLGENNEFWLCRIRGKLKIDTTISSTNPIAVGDKVDFDMEDKENRLGVITNIQSRQNYIVRNSPHNRRQQHIVAANLDLALLVATLKDPRTSIGFIDRFLVTAEAYHIPATIVFNKADLITDEEDKLDMDSLVEMYEKVGYKVWQVSASTGMGIDALKKFLEGSTTLFSGHSGVGKSTLINALLPDLSLKVGEISSWSGKGQHTTTFAEMFDGIENGKIIDTPGVKEFGIVNIEVAELAHYFPEMRELMHDCKFNNCQHINEPHCAVKNGVEDGVVDERRYHSYLAIMESIQDQTSY